MSSSIRPPSLAALAAMALALTAGAQERPRTTDPRPETFSERVEVEVVNVEVFVTDRDGPPVTGLEKTDFELRVDGQELPIEYFYRAAGERAGSPAADPAAGGDEPPQAQRLHLVVVVDHANIRAVNRSRVFRELRSFLAARLAEGARVAVASLEPELVIHSDLLDDPGAVTAILEQLERSSDRPRTEEMERQQILSQLSPTGRIYNRADYADPRTLTFDSPELIARIRAYAESEFSRSQNTLQNLARVVSTLAGVEGRKALLHVSDGIANRPGEEMFLAWSYRYGDATPAPQGYRSAGINTDYFREIGRFDLIPQFRELARLANAAGVGWYAIDAEADHTAALKTAALAGGVASEALDALETNIREPAEAVAELTGGQRLQASTDLGLDLKAIGDFDTYYSLGFTPPPGSERGAHSIRVKVRRKGLSVRHRDSFELKSSDERMADATVAALLYHQADNPLGVVLQAGAAQPRDDGAWLLPVEVQIPVDKLVLAPIGDAAYGTQLSLFVTVKGRDGQPRPVQKLPFTANIPADKLDEMRGRSARYTLPVVVRAGDQQIAVGIRDELGAAASCVRLEIDRLHAGP